MCGDYKQNLPDQPFVQDRQTNVFFAIQPQTLVVCVASVYSRLPSVRRDFFSIGGVPWPECEQQ
jgi:hypothetical protein